MGTSGSKPDWYPGEPADNFNAPQCLCNEGPHPTAVSMKHTAAAKESPTSLETRAAAPPPGASAGLGGGSKHEKGEREITSLPVVALTDMQFIANGAFCAVYACKYRGWSVVAKRVRQDLPLSERKAALANLWTEYDCLRPLSHPNVIDAYGMCRVRCREGYEDWNEKDVCLLLEELAFGTVGHLFETIVPKGKKLATAMARSRKMKMVPFRCRLHRALELAQALEYVHEGSGIGHMLHRDVKSVNVGFARNGSLKLMDFGLAKRTPIGGEEDGTYKMTGEVGSYRYMAPELVKHEPYNSKVDIYSWAILSWEILAIDKPYTGINESTFVTKVVLGGDRPDLRKSWPDRLCKLLAAAWHADHTKRPTAAEIVTVLKIVHAELAPKAKRRPSNDAAAAAAAAAARSGSGGGRRHSWTPQMSSATTPSALGLTRLPSGSGTADGAGPERGSASATRKTTDGTAPRPLSSPSFSPGLAGVGRNKSASLPVPLTSSAFSASTRRRWFPTLKKASGGTTSGQSVGSGLGIVTGGSPSGKSGGDDKTSPPGASPSGRRRSRSVPVFVGADGVDAGATGDGSGEAGCEVDLDRAPEWTATRSGAADASTGDDRACRCQLHQTLVSQREMIADALRRETEGLMSPARAARVSPRNTVRPEAGVKKRTASTATNAGVCPEEAGDEKNDRHVEGVTAALDASSSVRRNSSVGKLWPSTSSPGRNSKDEDTAPAATTDVVGAIQTTILQVPSANVGGGRPEDTRSTHLTE